MSDAVVWSEIGDPVDFSVAPSSVSGTTFLTAIPQGWTWRMLPDGTVVVCHPDYPPRQFDPRTSRWSEATPCGDGIAFIDMSQQP